MNDKEIEYLVERIVQRLAPPVLVMISAGTGYRRAIRRRLAECGHRLHLLMDENMADADQWQSIGERVPAGNEQDVIRHAPYRALLLPFLDYSLAADVVNGYLQNPQARHVHNALLSGLPVMALRYHCDPTSELNQLSGAQPDTAYSRHMQTMLARLEECGVRLCTMNELIEKLASESESASLANIDTRRYFTVADVATNPALALLPEARLTDAAIEFLNTRK